MKHVLCYVCIHLVISGNKCCSRGSISLLWCDALRMLLTEGNTCTCVISCTKGYGNWLYTWKLMVLYKQVCTYDGEKVLNILSH